MIHIVNHNTIDNYSRYSNRPNYIHTHQMAHVTERWASYITPYSCISRQGFLFQTNELLCWGPDLAFFNLRHSFSNILKALQICWSAVRNNKNVLFVNGNSSIDANSSLINMWLVGQYKREFIPRKLKNVLRLPIKTSLSSNSRYQKRVPESLSLASPASLAFARAKVARAKEGFFERAPEGPFQGKNQRPRGAWDFKQNQTKQKNKNQIKLLQFGIHLNSFLNSHIQHYANLQPTKTTNTLINPATFTLPLLPVLLQGQKLQGQELQGQKATAKGLPGKGKNIKEQIDTKSVSIIKNSNKKSGISQSLPSVAMRGSSNTGESAHLEISQTKEKALKSKLKINNTTLLQIKEQQVISLQRATEITAPLVGFLTNTKTGYNVLQNKLNSSLYYQLQSLNLNSKTNQISNNLISKNTNGSHLQKYRLSNNQNPEPSSWERWVYHEQYTPYGGANLAYDYPVILEKYGPPQKQVKNAVINPAINRVGARLFAWQLNKQHVSSLFYSVSSSNYAGQGGLSLASLAFGPKAKGQGGKKSKDSGSFSFMSKRGNTTQLMGPYRTSPDMFDTRLARNGRIWLPKGKLDFFKAKSRKGQFISVIPVNFYKTKKQQIPFIKSSFFKTSTIIKNHRHGENQVASLTQCFTTGGSEKKNSKQITQVKQDHIFSLASTFARFPPAFAGQGPVGAKGVQNIYLKRFYENIRLIVLSRQTRLQKNYKKGGKNNKQITQALPQKKTLKNTSKGANLKSYKKRNLRFRNYYSRLVTLNQFKQYQMFAKSPYSSNKLADIIFFINPEKNQSLVNQTNSLKIPTIGIVSGTLEKQLGRHNTCPLNNFVNYPILGNPASSFFIHAIVGLFIKVLNLY